VDFVVYLNNVNALMKKNSILLIGKCNDCWKNIFNNTTFIVLANRKRLCWDCYCKTFNNPSLISSLNNV